MATLHNIISQEIIQRIGWTLVHFVWQGAAVAVAAAVVLRILRNHRPTCAMPLLVRHWL